MEEVASAATGRSPPRRRAHPWVRAGAVVLVLLLAAYLFFGGGGLRASDLRLLPTDSSYILVADVDALYSCELADTLREAFADEHERLVKEMREEVGFGPEDIRQIAIGGNVERNRQVLIVVFQDDPEDETIDKFARSLRIGESGSHEVNGHRVWGGASHRMALGEVRGDVFLVGKTADVEGALRAKESAGGSELAELLVDEVGLDEPIAFAFDWRVRGAFPRDVERVLREIVPTIGAHVGPLVASAEIQAGVQAHVRILDRDREVIARYSAEVEGEFLEEVIGDLSRNLPRRGRVPEELPAPSTVRPKRTEPSRDTVSPPADSAPRRR